MDKNQLNDLAHYECRQLQQQCSVCHLSMGHDYAWPYIEHGQQICSPICKAEFDHRKHYTTKAYH